MTKQSSFWVLGAIGLSLLTASYNSSAEAVESLEDKKQASASSTFLTFLAGNRSKNAIFVGMWTRHHISPWGRARPVEDLKLDNNYLLGFQVYGFYASTFINSFEERVYSVGIARTLYSREFLYNAVQFDIHYKIGPLYGYSRGVPSIGRITVLPTLSAGLTFGKTLGFDINFVPASLASISFRLSNPL